VLGESVLVVWGALLPAGCVGADDDGDEVFDADDACPREAEDRDGFEDADGCPDPDDDADRIVDARDSCPRRRRGLQLARRLP